MLELVLTIVAMAVGGSLLVPLAMLIVARLGYLPPITVFAFGRKWVFARPVHSVAAQTNADGFPGRQLILSGAVSSVLIVAPPVGMTFHRSQEVFTATNAIESLQREACL